MNQVYYGNHAYGIEAAARTYFSVPGTCAHARAGGAHRGAHAGAVDVRPVLQPERALARRDEVLRAMFTTGAITPSQFNVAIADRDLSLKPASSTSGS
jgi:membrane peptidoglycan carboxypeptidase